LRAESVAWVSERKDVLCALLYLITIHLYLTYARDRTTRNYVAVLGMLILALLAKPMAVTIPAVLMLLDYWPLDRFQRRAWKRALLEKLPMWLIVAVACAVTLYAQSSGGAVVAKDDIPVDVRIASSVIAYVTYLQQTLVPTGLGAFYPQISMVDTDRLALGVTLPRVVLLGALTALVLLLRRGFPYLPVAWFWYVGTLVPVIGLVQVGAQSHADRYTYLPTVGLCIGLAVALSQARGAMGRAVLPTVVAGLIVANVVLYGLAYRQIGIWRDSKTLMGHTASVVPGSYFAKSMLASILITEDRRDEAERLVRSSLRDNPRHAYTYGVLATVYAEDQDYARAVRAARVGALMDVSSAASWGGYAFMLDRAGEYDLAVGAYRRAISIQPKDPLHKAQLAAVLAKRGNFDEAMDLWREAIAINPNVAIFRFGYGLALVIRDQPGAGISELREAVRLDPTEPDSLRQLAWILATHPDARWQDGPEAVRLAERALMESDRPTAELLDTLAAAHARAGNWPTAVRAADQALQLARTERRTDLVERISHRLTLYNARQAFPR